MDTLIASIRFARRFHPLVAFDAAAGQAAHPPARFDRAREFEITVREGQLVIDAL